MKTINAKIRMTPEEMDAHQREASFLGLNFSAWARMILKQASRRAAKK